MTKKLLLVFAVAAFLWTGCTMPSQKIAAQALDMGIKHDTAIVTENPQLHWHIALADSPTDKAFSVSFVNGIWTRSGKHVDEITNQVVTHFENYIESKKSVEINRR